MTEEFTSLVVVATVDDMPTVPDAHVTLFYFGELSTFDPQVLTAVEDEVEQIATQWAPFTAKASGLAILGEDKAKVVLLESWELVGIREQMWGGGGIRQGWLAAMDKQYPSWIPHTTLTYEDQIPDTWPDQVQISGLGVWKGEDKVLYPLVGDTAVDDDDQDVLEAAALIPPIHTERDLDMGLRVADVVPSARWYVAKRLTAFGQSARIPSHWRTGEIA